MTDALFNLAGAVCISAALSLVALLAAAWGRRLAESLQDAARDAGDQTD